MHARQNGASRSGSGLLNLQSHQEKQQDKTRYEVPATLDNSREALATI